MKKIFLTQLFILTGTALCLSACASKALNRHQCLDTDWYQQGVKDGADGYQRNIQEEVEQCAAFNVTVNPNLYLSGWRKGLSHFCNYETGYNLGAKGKNNPHTCPGNLRHIFNAGYEKGAAIFCQYAQNAYTLASKGELYPNACPTNRYPKFYEAYQRGSRVFQKESHLQQHIDNLNTRINLLINKFGFEQHDQTTYTLGARQDKRAKNYLQEVNQLAQQRAALENKLFKLEQQ